MELYKFYQWDIFSNSSSITSSIMEEFHDYTMMFLTMVTTFIIFIMYQIMKCKNTNYKFLENTNLEIIWTILPMIILMMIAYPSIFYLYLFDLSINPTFTTKVFGAQWYWIYEKFDNIEGSSYSSYMLNDETLMKTKYKMGWRLLETDTRLVLPYMTEVQCLVTSMDVIHSFSIPEIGIKIDAIPGRLNAINFQVSKPGVFYGQCTEICGTGHAFMPICMEAI
nr:cytochrome c oxidase subunit II [Neohydatothrips samayunkur]